MNPNGETHVLMFGLANVSNVRILAFEDWVGVNPSSDRDFNDLVLQIWVSDVNEVPEPASVLLMGSGLLFLCGRLRKKQ